MVAVDDKLIWGPSRNNLYNLAGSFGRRLCCKLLTDPLGGVCASLAPRRRPKLQRHIHTCYFLAAPWRQGRVLSRAAAAAAANRLGEVAAGESGGNKLVAVPISPQLGEQRRGWNNGGSGLVLAMSFGKDI